MARGYYNDGFAKMIGGANPDGLPKIQTEVDRFFALAGFDGGVFVS